MNKEQLLGRLLMNGHINMDELNILNEVIIKNTKTLGNTLEDAIAEKEKQKLETQSKKFQDWLGILNKYNKTTL